MKTAERHAFDFLEIRVFDIVLKATPQNRFPSRLELPTPRQATGETNRVNASVPSIINRKRRTRTRRRRKMREWR